MKTVATTPGGDREIARQINVLHAEAEQHRSRCSDAVYEALRAAWQAGHLLIKQKKKIVHGNWELWLERNFEGKVRTAQRYMLLAKAVPDVLQLRGLTLRQAYLRLGIAVAENPHGSAQRYAVLPPHAALANRFQRWMRQKQNVGTLPEQERRTLRLDLRPIYDWLVRLFDEDSAKGGA
jgi:hypothetical protein